jgi:uncharacterized protein (UPF0332 family)
MTPEGETLLNADEAKIKAAKHLQGMQLNGDAASRTYYAVFHAISALHLEYGNSFSSHAQLIGRFNRDFVRTGIFPPIFTRILTRLFEDRQLGDYDATAEITSEQTEQDIADAHQIIEAVRAHLQLKTQNPPK